MHDFRQINFGFSDASNEARRFPDLLLNGYLDEFGIAEEALKGFCFLFLGAKGAGKSALSEHLKLSYKTSSEIFIRTLLLKSFPYDLFQNIIKGYEKSESRYTKAWEWLL